MPKHTVNGQRIYYEDTGGEGPPVVLSHGLLMDHELFGPQVEALHSDYRVITWDQRCHGLTESTADQFTYWDSADDLAGLLDHLDVQQAVLGGMSQGGFVSMRLALRHPERVSALVLFDSQAGVEDPDKAATYGVMLDVWEAEGLHDPMAETIAAILFGSEWPGRRPWIEKWRRQSPERLRPAFNALMCAGLANCRGLVQIEGGGHSSNLTNPEPVNKALTNFLSVVAASALRAS